jgi:Ca2+-binding RTX toxin-like protein
MRPVLSAAATVCFLFAMAAPALAAPIPVDLRVEGGNGRALTADRYLTDSTKIKTAKQPPSCNGSGKAKKLPGTTALGTLVDGALVNNRLDPLLVSDEFSFGLLVCGVGGSNSGGASSFWLYKVNHVSPEVGGEAFAVKPSDDVLWYFVNGASNSGDELELVAPARVKPGQQFDVSVAGYDFAGARHPVAGATVAGGGATGTTDASGVAHLTLNRGGTRTLRATLDPNIPSAPTKVCVNADLSKCAPARGTRIWGSRRAESIAGTTGRDSVLAGAGNDTISVRRGSVDRVRCGAGNDTVRAGRRDRVAADCEHVSVRGRQ